MARLPFSKQEKLIACIEWYELTENDSLQTAIEDMSLRGHAQNTDIKGESQWALLRFRRPMFTYYLPPWWPLDARADSRLM